MSNSILILIISWIIIFCSAWLIVRKFRPHWIGLGQDFNAQKIDGVKYKNCPKCQTGVLEPQFKRSFFRPIIGIPPGILYRIGLPKEYRCLNCGDRLPGNYFGEKITRISLASRIPRKDAFQIIIIMVLLFIAAGIYSIFIH